MSTTKPLQRRIVIFGAGNIGRSFIAPVFTAGGYEAIFADVAPAVLEALEERNHYTLVEKSSDREHCQKIEPVRGIDARDSLLLKRELEEADICATCVGAAALPTVLRSIAAVSLQRQRPLDIILAENLKNAGSLARKILQEAFDAAGSPRADGGASGSAPDVEKTFGIVESSIGKMVPIMPLDLAAADPLLCWAEAYNTLIVDADGFLGPVPQLPDIKPVSPIEPWVARKLYIHNLGHAAAAYLGAAAHPKAEYIWEVLDDPKVFAVVKEAMTISGWALQKEYPGVFSPGEIDNHVADLIHRFRNKALKDTLYRVGRDLRRKLHRTDRVVGAIALAMKHHLPTEALLAVFTAALKFAAPAPNGRADESDKAVRKLAANPAEFLNQIVEIDRREEPEVFSALESAFQQAADTD